MSTEGQGAVTDFGVDGYLKGPALARPARIDVATAARRRHRSSEPERMEAWLTGTGAPIVNANRTGPSSVVRCGGDVILVDVGNCTAYQVVRLGIALSDVTHIFVTHHHLDHVADLGFLLMIGWVTGSQQQVPTVVGPRGTAEFVQRLLSAYDYDIRVRIPQGYDADRLRPEVIEIDDGDRLTGRGWTATAFRVNHFPVDQAFGYRFDGAGVSIAFSGDTVPCDNLIEHTQGVDVLVHEVLEEGHGFADYHTLATDVGKVAARSRAKHLVLNHLLPHDRPDHLWVADVERDFNGTITVGRDLLRICG